MVFRTLALMRKEFRHMFRDRRTLTTLFAIPIVQLILLGYAANTNVEHLATAVLDLDRSAQSRDLIATYQASNYFDIVIYPADRQALGRLIDRGEVRTGIVIPPGQPHDSSGDRGAKRPDQGPPHGGLAQGRRSAPVVYAALEGEAGFKLRAQAWEAYQGRKLPAGLQMVLQACGI